MRRGLYAASLVESLAVVLLERGVYFYTRDVLGFSDTMNLWMGLLMGVTYAAGALASHRLAQTVGEKRLAVATLGLHLMLALVAMVMPSRALMLAMYPLIGLLSGAYWPVIESYVTAGKTSRSMLRAVGRFCIAWSVAVPVAMAVAGPLIDSGWAESIFALTALCHAAALLLLLPLPGKPTHTPADHPDRPADDRLTRYATLLVASRWCMLSGYALLFLLSPLLPEIFRGRLGLSNAVATPLVSLMDWTRVIAFAGMMGLTFWYGRALPVLAGAIVMPVGFALVLFGPTLPWVLAGELMFGLATGLVYYAALYYALAIKNAAVEAGGVHEALIGGGFALGPMCGLIGIGLSDAMGSHITGMLLGASPLILLGFLGGSLPLLKLRRPSSHRDSQ